MNIEASQIYHQYDVEHNLDPNILNIEGKNALRTTNTSFIGEVESSKKLINTPGPASIIPASGMCNGGRIVNHLKWRLLVARNSLLLVGNRAEGSRSRMLLDGSESLTIHAARVHGRGQIGSIDAPGGRAGWQKILCWVNGFKKRPRKLLSFMLRNRPIMLCRITSVNDWVGKQIFQSKRIVYQSYKKMEAKYGCSN